jgi:hypothetical protein
MNWDALRETAPFLVGLLVPPVVMLAMRPGWTGQARFLAAFLPALVLGVCTSALAGELLAGMPDGLIAVIIDTSLVFTGSQIAYRFFWKPVLEPRLERLTGTKLEQAPRRVRE